jgi:probable rRNA maturation factor
MARWLASVAPASAAGCDVSVAIVSDAFMRKLNRRFRCRPEVTDVLSFATGDSGDHAHHGDTADHADRGSASPPGTAKRAADAHHPRALGDIVIAAGVAARQARRIGHPYAVELRVLALHGLVHLLGYDHGTDSGEMARVERRLRRRGGLPGGLVERAARA